jgi:hypothetical protein
MKWLKEKVAAIEINLISSSVEHENEQKSRQIKCN